MVFVYYSMKTSVIILISLFTTGMTANSYCDQQYQQLQTATIITLNKNVPLRTLPSKLAVILIHYFTSILNLLVFTKRSVGVEENGVPLVFTVILKQQMEDGQ